MAKMTKRSMSLTDGFVSEHGKREIVQKLGYIEHRGEELAGEVCDHCCRYPAEADSDELKTICEACPVTRLIELFS